MATATLTQTNTNSNTKTSSSIPTTSQASVSSSSIPVNPNNHTKSKKRARFADENSQQNTPNHTQQQQSLSSFITFNHDDPPQKKNRSHVEPSSFDQLFDPSASDTLRQGMYLTFINTAFAERANGKFERYDQLLGQFDPLVSSHSSTDPNPPDVSIERVQGWLSALTYMISQLDRSHSHLVEKVVSLPWTVLDDQFVSVFSRFVNGLVSARSEWVQIVLENLVQGFHYDTIPFEHRSDLLPSSVNRRLIYARLHSLLRSILRLIPTLPSTLWPILVLYFPKKREHRDGHVCYLHNLLKIACYCPDLSAKIVQLCIEKCLHIDVEIPVGVEEWEDDEGRLEEGIFGRPIEDALDKPWTNNDGEDSDVDEEEEDGVEEVDFDDLSSDEGGDMPDEDNSKPLPPRLARKDQKLAAKLDGMLRCIFDHLQQISFGCGLNATSTTITNHLETAVEEAAEEPKETNPTSPTDLQRQSDREAIFDILLCNFESSILRTRRTRYVQFIIFWYASLDPRFTESFLVTLVERGLYERGDNTLPVAIRVAAVSYIASLISRAKFIDKRVTRQVVSLLCARLELGMKETDKMKVNGHVIWYAIAQAIFYIFCFRWKDLLVAEDDEELEQDGDDEFTIHLTQPKKFNDRWLSGLKILERAITSPLNPLKTCTEPVVTRFAKISHQTNFMYCYDIIRRNHSWKAGGGMQCSSTATLGLVSLPASTQSSSSGEIAAPLSSCHEQIVNRALFESKSDLFFPFDPFKLPHSSVYLDSIYRSWTEVNGDGCLSDSESDS